MSGKGNRNRNASVLPFLSLWAIALFIGALAIRLFFLFELKELPFYRNLFSDALIYTRLAEGILHGEWGERAFFMSPLYPVFIAAVKSVFQDVYFWVRGVQCILGAVLVVLIYQMGREWKDELTGKIAGVLAVICPLFIYHDNAILLESLLTFFVIVHFTFLARMLRNPKLHLTIGAGISLGLSIVLRSNLVLYLVGLFIFLIAVEKRLTRMTALLVASAALMILPFTLHNYGVERLFLPVTSSFGYNFYAGNNPASVGFYSVPEVPDMDDDLNGTRYAERTLGRKLNSAEVSSFWFEKASRWISENPSEFMAHLLRKLVLFFHTDEIDQQGFGIAFIQDEFSTILDLPLPGFALLFFPALAGLFFLKKSKERSIVLIFLGTYVLGTILFFVNSRLRLPIMPFVIVLAAIGVTEFISALRANALKQLLKPLTMALSIFVVMIFVQPDVGSGYELNYSRVGNMEFDNGRFEKAESFFRRSIQTRPTAYGLTNLGNALAAQGKYDDALEVFKDAITMDSTYHLAHFNYGNALLQRGSAEAAARAWQRCLDLRPEFAPAWRNIGLLLVRAGRIEPGLRRLRKYLEVEPNPVRRREIEADIEKVLQMMKHQDGQ